jgi:hypothetical protein
MLTVREEHELRVLENRVLRRIFGPKRDGVLRIPHCLDDVGSLTTVGDPPRLPRDTPLSTKVGTKFRLQVAVVNRYSSLED